MSAVVIIPARYASTRLPGKPLIKLLGKPLIQYVYEASKKARLVDEVVVATDDRRILETVEGFGGKAVMTSASHPSGTDRIAEVARALNCDIVVNVQGDEPLMRPEMIDDVVRLLQDDAKADMATLCISTDRSDEIFNPNVVKVVTDQKGFALYFSRAPIAFYRDCVKVERASGFYLYTVSAPITVKKHIGIYGYRRNVLLQLTRIPQSPLEQAEKLEQLRALENGYRIKVKETEFETIGVDTPEDVEMVEEMLKNL